MHTLHLLNVPDHAAPYPPKQLTAQFIFHIFKSSCKCRRISVHTGRCHPDGTCSGDLSDKNKLLLVHRILLVFHTLPKSFLRLILPYIIPTSQTCKKQAHLPVAKELLYTGSSFSLWKVTKIIFLFHQNYFSRKKFCGYRFRLHVLLLKLSTVSINSLLRRVEFIDFCGWFLHASFLSDHFFRVIHMKK